MALDAGMACRKLLIDDAAVAAILGTRIRPLRANQKDARPYCVYRTISGRRLGHLEGTSLVNRVIIQIDGYCDTEQESVDLVKAIRSELDGRIRTNVTLSGNNLIVSIYLRDERDLPVVTDDGSDDGIYGFQLDFLVLHQEAA